MRLHNHTRVDVGTGSKIVEYTRGDGITDKLECILTLIRHQYRYHDGEGASYTRPCLVSMTFQRLPWLPDSPSPW